MFSIYRIYKYALLQFRLVDSDDVQSVRIIKKNRLMIPRFMCHCRKKKKKEDNCYVDWRNNKSISLGRKEKAESVSHFTHTCKLKYFIFK